jgi:asparagine synthase (glutamine-hydrolysing)
MCGLNGILSYGPQAPAISTDELLRSREQMRARGPDDAGMWVSEDRRVALAHRRLAIIDLSPDGAQPMATPDGRYRIVFNGEIYNYRELQTLLRSRGVALRSQSDTEVLLHLYALEGPEMCRRLRGMYAFALWDAQQQSLFLARDPFGIKPLYLHDDGRTLRFASQVQALMAGGAIAPAHCPDAEYGYWIWGHVPEPWTLHPGIRSLPAGHWLRIGHGGASEDGVSLRVQDILAGTTTTAAEPATPLPQALLDTVRHHLIADVPVGVFLSAGIDSASLVALAAQVVAESGGQLRTLTLGFEEYRGTPSDETPLAEQVARQYGTQHETVWIGRKDFEHAFSEFIQAMDLPTIDGLNTWLVARAAAQRGIKVALSGLGGDELFGGYPSFRQLPQMRRLARPFARIPGLGKAARQLSAPLLRRLTSEKYAGLLEYGATWQGAYLLRRAVRMPWEVPGPPRPAVLGLEANPQLDHLAATTHPALAVSLLESTRYMRHQLLRDADWAGMAHSLEIRVPLVDVVLAAHVARQAATGSPWTKQDLAAAAQPPLPDALIHRPKTGFTVPVRDWMQVGVRTPTPRGLRGWQEAVFTLQAAPR